MAKRAPSERGPYIMSGVSMAGVPEAVVGQELGCFHGFAMKGAVLAWKIPLGICQGNGRYVLSWGPSGNVPGAINITSQEP